MTTIEDKIKLFSKIVYDKIKQEKEKDFEAFENEKAETIRKETEALEQRNAAILEETSRRAKLKANEIISAEKMESKQEVLELKQKLINNTMDELRKRMEKFAEGEEYRSFLVNELENTLKSLDAGNYILCFTERDIKRYKNEIESEVMKYSDMNIEIAEHNSAMIGGLLLKSTSGKFRIDSSLAAQIEESRERVGVKITERVV